MGHVLVTREPNLPLLVRAVNGRPAEARSPRDEYAHTRWIREIKSSPNTSAVEHSLSRFDHLAPSNGIVPVGICKFAKFAKLG
jgi:hypothetical protein